MTTEKTTPVEQVVENMEPNWPGMFRYAVHIVKLSLPENFPDKGPGQQVVVEMLEFGKRLYEAAAADQKGAEIERLKEEIEGLKVNFQLAKMGGKWSEAAAKSEARIMRAKLATLKSALQEDK